MYMERLMFLIVLRIFCTAAVGVSASELPWTHEEVKWHADASPACTVWTVRPCNVQARVNDRLGMQLTTVFTSVFVAAQLRANVSIVRRTYQGDAKDMAGLFGKHDEAARWDFRPNDDSANCYGDLPVNSMACCDGWDPVLSPTTHALRELVIKHIAPLVHLDNIPGPDADALVIYLRAGDIMDPNANHVSEAYVQAPCSFFRRVIRDSGLFKVDDVVEMNVMQHIVECPQIDIVTDPTAQGALRNPCLAELEALPEPYRVAVHGMSVLEDFGFITKAHHLVLPGLSTFADTAMLLSRTLHTLYVSTWNEGPRAWKHEGLPAFTTGWTLSYHDLPGINVHRYMVHDYYYWSFDGPQHMLDHKDDQIQRLHRFENVPIQHSHSREGFNAMAPTHSLVAVVHACGGQSLEQQFHRALKEIDAHGRAGRRVPLLVLAKDAHEAEAMRGRIGMYEDTMTFQIDQDSKPRFKRSKLYGLAIVGPADGVELHTPAVSCSNPHVEAVRIALAASEATFNVTHLLFANAPDFASYLSSTYMELEHVHGHHDRLRIFVEGDKPLCPAAGWDLQDHPLATHRALLGCGDPVGALVAARGSHIQLIQRNVAGGAKLLSDVCWRGMLSRACVYGWSRL